MTKNLDSGGLQSIADNYDLFYIDLWGVVHNGIIENYSSLKKALEDKGYVFKSDTDSEVLMFLIEDVYKNMDTISMEYVTDDANTGLEILISLLNNIFASAVPKTAKIKT